MSVAESTVFLQRVTVGIEMMVYSHRWLGWDFDEACECVMMYEDCHDQTRFCPALARIQEFHNSQEYKIKTKESGTCLVLQRPKKIGTWSRGQVTMMKDAERFLGLVVSGRAI